MTPELIEPDPIKDLLDRAAALGDQPGHAVLRELGAQLAACAATIDVGLAASLVTKDEPRHFISTHASGPLMALRWYEPGFRSTVHAHAWTLLVGLKGEGTLERFALGDDGRAHLVSADPTDAPNVAAIDGGEIHRQLAGPEGALELVLIGEHDPDRGHLEYDE